ncbi:Gfo/Idh/MocA family protein [Acidimangrovimonas pyrenivorans]|uniref:Gfo/Idh/MocA family protein n=1 Tax=Acidimangrovimonas pyrenivorans TaxID=2030798 RepID=A0ABV7AK31_9RHOB
MSIPVTVVGIGKIARDQHLPAIAGNPDFHLAAAVSRHGTVEGVPNFTDFDRFLAEGPAGPVALCTPPSVRLEMALKTIAAGRDLLIEKPPAATLGEIETISAAARDAGVVLFATWHSRFAPAVAPARAWIAERKVERVTITWKEDVRRWHPGQAWIWQPGGFGVFDPGINALSILTEILPGAIHVGAATLEVPQNCATPIAAQLAMTARGTVPVAAAFDWRHEGVQTWDIEVEASGQRLTLGMGGAQMAIDGTPVDLPAEAEYPEIYRHFARLVAARESDADFAPLRLCADAFLVGRQVAVAPFTE